MTRIGFIHGSDGCVSVEGHAGYAERGRDVVCAAVSTLCNSIMVTFRVLERYGHCVSVSVQQEDGVFRLSYREGDEAVADTMALYEELARGYAAEYSKYLAVT